MVSLNISSNSTDHSLSLSFNSSENKEYEEFSSSSEDEHEDCVVQQTDGDKVSEDDPNEMDIKDEEQIEEVELDEVTPDGEQQQDPFVEHFDAVYDEDFIKKIPENLLSTATFTSPLLGNYCLKKRPSGLSEISFKTDIDQMSIKKSLEHTAKSMIEELKSHDEKSSNLRTEMLCLMTSYLDLLYLDSNFEKMAHIRWSYSLHVLNHLLKVRQKIINNNSKIEKIKLSKRKVEENSDEYEKLRDQGFTRPRVLIVLPFRESAKEVVQNLSTLLFGNKDRANTIQMKRFLSEFSTESTFISSKKPDDFNQTFEGNTDDSFRLGISITKKSLKLYTEFYTSDLILCSPLALRMMISGEKDYDFLSSIEIVILDQMEIFLMQNWEHVIEIMRHLNLQPKKPHGIDFTRVKMPLLDGFAKYYRQTLMFGSVHFNEAYALFSKYSQNFEGQIMFQNKISPEKSIMKQVFVGWPQKFVRHECSSIDTCADDRFKYFTQSILPQIKNEPHVLVYVSSYFDFVRLRNHFRREDVDFTGLCEYTKDGKIAQGRAQFFHESRKLLLITERFHFYRRFNLKGVRKVIFYQMPTFPLFYAQICNLMLPQLQGKKFNGDTSCFSCLSLFCKFDGHRIASVLGTDKSCQLINSKKSCITLSNDDFL